MTNQPPPSPPGGTPPLPPPGGAAPAPFDPKSVNPLDWGILGAGVIVFLFSFIGFYDGVTVEANGKSQDIDSAGTASAWNDVIGGGFFGWFAMLFGIAGAVVVALALFAPQVKLPVPARLAGLGLFALGTVFEILAIFVTPSESSSLGLAGGGDVDVTANHGVGFWISLIALLAGLVLSLMRFQATGGELPGGVGKNVPNLGGYGPQGGLGGGTPPPPPAGGTPPPPPSNYGPPR